MTRRLFFLLAAALMFTSQAAADTVYTCTGGTFMTYVDATREVRISGLADGVSIALPFAGAMGRFSTWSPRGMDAVGEEIAPYAQYWQPATGPAQVWFELEQGKRHDCVEAAKQ